MSSAAEFGRIWFDALRDSAVSDTPAPSLCVATGTVGAETVTLLAVMADPGARFPRARNGEVGLEEGWGLAREVRKMLADSATDHRQPIVVIVDVPSQAYGYTEELLGVHQALAAAVDAFATARSFGHPVVGFIVGKAISGAFLATGLQANRLVALNHDGVSVQVMSKAAAARITRRSVAELDAIAERVPATAYDIASFATLGALHSLVDIVDPAAPSAEDIATVSDAIADAIVAAREFPSDLSSRLTSSESMSGRAASIEVRQIVNRDWNSDS